MNTFFENNFLSNTILIIITFLIFNTVRSKPKKKNNLSIYEKLHTCV